MSDSSARPAPTPGTSVVVEVPATSANLGPGFDCFGLALDWRDRVIIEVAASGLTAVVTGEGAGQVPADASHLIVTACRIGLEDLGVAVPGLRVISHNTIPHGRGLGSSSAAIVAGLAAALALAGRGLDHDWLLGHAARIEGHPDNVAAAIHGGFVLAYAEAGQLRAAGGYVSQAVRGTVFVPASPVPTRAARGLLPASVPHGDAAANAGRAALLVHALAREPALLFPATRDWLHQDHRRAAMPESHALLTRLRAEGYAAVISGAGPTVLVLGTTREMAPLLSAEWPGFEVRPVRPGPGVSIVG